MEVDLGGILSLNSTYDYVEDYEYKEEVESGDGGPAALIPVLYSLLTVAGLAGNGLLLTVLAWKWRSWRASDTFILHLCVSDVLLLATLPLWAAQAALPSGWTSGDALCKISGAVFNINFYCGIFLLACISLDRCLSLVHGTPLYFLKRPALTHVSCLLVWSLCLLLSIPDWIYFGAKKVGGTASCVASYSPSGSDMLSSRLCHHVLGFLLPAAPTIICSGALLAWRQRSERRQKRGAAAVAVVAPLAAAFFLCWLPYNVALLADTFLGRGEPADAAASGHRNEGSLKATLRVTWALGCVHACLRPLLYLGLCGKFRGRALALLRCAPDETKGSLWGLDVGGKALAEQSLDVEERKPMTCVEQHEQATEINLVENGRNEKSLDGVE